MQGWGAGEAEIAGKTGKQKGTNTTGAGEGRGGQLSLTMRVGVDCDRPGACTACLVPAVVRMLHPGAWGAVVNAFILGPQTVQS